MIWYEKEILEIYDFDVENSFGNLGFKAKQGAVVLRKKLSFPNHVF